MRLDIRWLGVKQKLRVRQTQPLLRIVAQISGEIGGVFGGNHFYEYSRFYRILQAHCKAEQLGSVEQFTGEDRVENPGEIRWIARDKPQRAVTIQSDAGSGTACPLAKGVSAWRIEFAAAARKSGG